MATSLLSARGLGRRDPAGGRWLLRDASLELGEGERVAVIGPSGSGKSVLLRALAMLDPLDAGEVRFRGEMPAGAGVPAFRSKVLYLHQRPVLLSGPVRESLLHPLRFRCHRRSGSVRGEAAEKAMMARAEPWLAALGRGTEFLEQSAGDLSGGEAQIVALLRALLLEPEVLLLDEPTASLDEEAAAAVEELVTAWHSAQEGRRAYLWVTHLAQQSERVADRGLRVERGRLAAVGGPGKVAR